MLKNVIFVLLSNGGIAFIGLINCFLFPIILTKSDYAMYQEYMLYVSYVNICHLGIASGMFLNYAGHSFSSLNKKQYKSEIYLLLIVLLFFTLLFFFVFLLYKKNLFLYIVITIIPQCLICSFLALYQSWERFTAYSVINLIPKLLLTLTIIILSICGFSNGDTLIISYVLIVWSITLYFIHEFIVETKGIRSNNIFSEKNLRTTWNGFLITIGNYVNVIFHSIDKQFVLIFFSKDSFALYSFAMALQNIMLIFISAIATPFYPILAKGNIDFKQIKKIKELLLVFSSYSGCAFFFSAFFVSYFISKYNDSLLVCAMFFSVFPAVAIINVLYVTFYRVKRMLYKYIFTLVGMLVISIIANYIAVLFSNDYVGISVATVICYYIWLFYSERDFEEIFITVKDKLYILGFIFIYFLSIKIIDNYILGGFIYAMVITTWNYFFYKRSIKYLISYFLGKRENMG